MVSSAEFAILRIFVGRVPGGERSRIEMEYLEWPADRPLKERF